MWASRRKNQQAESKTIEIIQSEVQKEKRIKKNEHWMKKVKGTKKYKLPVTELDMRL